MSPATCRRFLRLLALWHKVIFIVLFGRHITIERVVAVVILIILSFLLWRLLHHGSCSLLLLLDGLDRFDHVDLDLGCLSGFGSGGSCPILFFDLHGSGNLLVILFLGFFGLVGSNFGTLFLLSLSHVQNLKAWLVLEVSLFRFCFDLFPHSDTICVPLILDAGLLWTLLSCGTERFALLGFGEKALFGLCWLPLVISLGLAYLLRHAKYLIVRVPSHLLDRGEALIVLSLRLLPRLLPHASLSQRHCFLELGQLLLDLFELLLFFLTALPGLSDAFELDLVLAFAIFALSSLCFPLSHLILLPFSHFSCFFGLFFLFNLALLFFLLGSYTHDLFLLFSCGFLCGSAPFLLLLLFLFPLSFGFFALGSEPLHGIDPFGLLSCLLLFFFPARIGLGPHRKPLFIGLSPGFHELKFFLDFLVFFICDFLFLPFFGSLDLSTLFSIF